MSPSPGPPPRPRRRESLEVETASAPADTAASARSAPDQGVPPSPAAPTHDARTDTERQGESKSRGMRFSASSLRKPTLGRPRRGEAGSVEAPVRPVASSGLASRTRAAVEPSDGAVRIDFREKNKERTQARFKLIIHRLLLALGGVAAATVLVWVVFFSSVFALNPAKIKIESEQSGALDPVVRSVVESRVGTPLPRLSTAGLEAELTELPSVISAKVTKSWPSGVDVQVTKRAPQAMLETDQGYALVGEDGVTVEVVPEPVEGLPLVTATATDEDDVRKQAALGVQVWSALPDGVKEQVTGVAVDGTAVTLDLASGARVVWGTSEDSDVKAQVLALLMEQAPAETYDLRDPRRPVTS